MIQFIQDTLLISAPTIMIISIFVVVLVINFFDTKTNNYENKNIK